MERLFGWHPDPYGRHELRYFSSGGPTSMVRDGEVTSSDPVPGAQPAGAGERPPSVAATPSGAPERSTRRKGAFAVAFAVVVVAALVAMIVGFTGGGHPSSKVHSGAELASLVQAATNKTLGERTADMTLTGNVTVAARSIPISGSGEIDFRNDDAIMSVNVSEDGVQTDMKELLVDHEMYMSISSDGRSLASLLGGKSWIEVQIPQISDGVSLGSSGMDPVSDLHLLAARGAKVTSLGTSTTDGVRETGYHVVIGRQTMLGLIGGELKSPSLQPSLKKEIEAFEKGFNGYTMSVWVDSATNLLARANVDISLSVPGSASSVSGHVTMLLNHYGTPVHVSAPPANQVEQFSQFADGLLSGGGSSSSSTATTVAP